MLQEKPAALHANGMQGRRRIEGFLIFYKSNSVVPVVAITTDL